MSEPSTGTPSPPESVEDLRALQARTAPRRDEPAPLNGLPAARVEKLLASAAVFQARSAPHGPPDVAPARAALAQHLGARYAPECVRLDRLQSSCPEEARVLQQVRGLATQLTALVERGDGIIWYGAHGTGKDTHLAALLYEAVGQGFTCRYLGGQQLFCLFRDAMDNRRPDAHIMQPLLRPQILALSDLALGGDELSTWETKILYALVEARYRDRKSTWLTINAGKPEEIDTILASSVWDRLRHGAVLIPCFWASHRRPRVLETGG